MNVLIADSGSTKTHWTLTNNHQQEYYTQGISPFYLSEKEIVEIIKNELLTQIGSLQVEQVFFYGTGCSQDDKIQIVKNALQNALHIDNVFVEHDLLAAARATCGTQKGITCILGTGSNSCLFDGENIIDNIPSLGFLLGDEASGAWFGRKLLQAYFYRELPADLKTAFESDFPFSKAEILDNVYGVNMPSKYVASFMPFLYKHVTHNFIEDILTKGFNEFIERMILKYEASNQLPIHFIGSVAFLNQNILAKCLESYKLNKGIILKSPIEGLVKYHLANQ